MHKPNDRPGLHFVGFVYFDVSEYPTNRLAKACDPIPTFFPDTQVPE